MDQQLLAGAVGDEILFMLGLKRFDIISDQRSADVLTGFVGLFLEDLDRIR